MVSVTSTEDVNNFLEALDTIQKDYSCGLCSEICKDPIELSKCFHIICRDHFATLKNCPECGISLAGCGTFDGDRLNLAVCTAKRLDKIFEKYKPKKVPSSKAESSSSSINKQTTHKPEPKKKSVTGDKEKSFNKPKTPLSEINTISNKQNTVKEFNTKNTALNISVSSNLSSKFSKALEKRNVKGETVLHVACRLGRMDKVEECLKEGANTNTKDNAGWTPLHEAVQNGKLDLVRLLLQYNTLIDVPGPGNETPLHEAVRYNHIQIAEELVRNGADINVRNCKGETPIQLAEGEMKEALERAVEIIVQTQGLNVTYISMLHSELDMDDIRIYCVSQFRTAINKLKVLAKHHSNVHIEAKFTKKVTHLIVDTEDGICVSSLDVLQAIANGIWILSMDWVIKSTDDKLEPFNTYEVKGVGKNSNNGPIKSRYNKYKQLPGIFNGCHFYLHNFNVKYEITKNIVVTKAILSKLITDAGGVVLRRVPNPELIPDSEKLVPYHARKDSKLWLCSHYIIYKDMYEPMYNMQHLKALPIGWLIECLEKYELCDP